MRSKRAVHAVVRGIHRPWGREPQVKTMSEDTMLWQLTRNNSQKALTYRQPLRLRQLFRSALRRVLGVFGLF